MRLKPLAAVVSTILVVPFTLLLTSGTSIAYACNSPAYGSWSNNCTVENGSVSDLVIGVQEFINGWGSCGQLSDDGDFGPLTETAVKCFQSDAGISSDGIVGPITWGHMQGDLRKGPSSGGWQYWRDYPSFNNFREDEGTGLWGVWDANAAGWVDM
jgi:peptidoglycan hydrolase-like protein with peptidoglycan-binding domain